MQTQDPNTAIFQVGGNGMVTIGFQQMPPPAQSYLVLCGLNAGSGTTLVADASDQVFKSTSSLRQNSFMAIL